MENDLPSGTILEAIFKGSNFMFYHPATLGTTSKKPWLLVCLHSDKLDYEALFNKCHKLAKEKGLAVLAPYFDPIQFPNYHQMDYRSLDQARSDKFLWDLIAHVASKADIQTKKAYFYGEGHGGELLLNLSILKPERIARAVSVTNNVPIVSSQYLFPKGFAESPFFPTYKASYSSFYGIDIGVICSTKSRRAKRFFENLEKLAYNEGLTFSPKRITLDETPQSGRYLEAAATYLFPE